MRVFIYLGVLTIVLALTEGMSMRSGYEKPMKMAVQKMAEAQPEDRCKKVGQYLSIPGEQCKFLVCDYGSEPWKDSYGNIKLFTLEMPCAPGTFVQDSSTNGYGITQPCSGRHDTMCLPEKKSGYGMMSMKPASNTVKMEKMMMKKKEEMQTMSYEQTMTTMKQLGEMLQTSMPKVKTMTPTQKEQVEEISEKAEHTGYGEMGQEEMKSMCEQMMKMMVKMEEMKESSEGYGSSPSPAPMNMEEHTGYDSTPMVMVMPMEMGYGKAPEPAPVEMEMPHPMGYGMQPMMKMEQIMTMMKKMMKMMKQPQMMTQMGYGKMEEAQPEPEQQPTGYGMMPMMEAKPMMPSYGKMEQMMEKMMEKMQPMSGYGEMEPETEEPQGYGKMEEPEEKSSEYGRMKEPMMQKPVMIVMVPQKEMSKTYWD